jgi:hypothetical protein
MKSYLPKTDKYVNLSLLDGGSLAADLALMHAGSPHEKFRLYDWAFHIHNPSERKNAIWDLGMAPVGPTETKSIAMNTLTLARTKVTTQLLLAITTGTSWKLQDRESLFHTRYFEDTEFQPRKSNRLYSGTVVYMRKPL